MDVWKGAKVKQNPMFRVFCTQLNRCRPGNKNFSDYKIAAFNISLTFVEILDMQTQKKNTGLAWIIFFISTAVFFLAIYLHFSYLTLILPIMLTSFVKAMDIV